MRKILLITAAAIISTAASGETIYTQTIYTHPNSVVHWKSPVPFKSVIVAQEEDNNQDKGKEGKGGLVSVTMIPNDLNLFLNIKDPDDWTDGRNIFFVDKDGQVVAELTVIVTPNGEPTKTLRVYHGSTLSKSLLCGGSMEFCLPSVKPRKVTAEETTENRDGSVTHRKEY
jgi:hypothetical protein